MSLKKLISKLTLEELREGYMELKEKQETGSLPNGVVRKIHQEFLSNTSLSNLEFGVQNVETPLLMEIAKRTFDKRDESLD